MELSALWVWRWRILLLVAGAFEIRALSDLRTGDTFSEFITTRMAQFWALHGLVLGFLVWLVFHFRAIGDPTKGMAFTGVPSMLIFVGAGLVVVFVQRVLFA